MMLLKVKFFRYLLTIVRFIFFNFLYKFKFAKFDKKLVKKGTVERNHKSLKSLRDCYSGERSSFFLKNKDKNLNGRQNKKILLVGPRNEGEIFNFIANGFASKNIDAIDLFSYSKKIRVFDMHNIHKLKKKYDLIYFGFILNYSKNITEVLLRAMLILKAKGFIGISNEYDNIPLMSKDKKKIHISRIKKMGYDFLAPLNKNYFLNKKIKKIFKIIFFKTYEEKLGIMFDKRKCMSLLIQLNEK